MKMIKQYVYVEKNYISVFYVAMIALCAYFKI